MQMMSVLQHTMTPMVPMPMPPNGVRPTPFLSTASGVRMLNPVTGGIVIKPQQQSTTPTTTTATTILQQFDQYQQQQQQPQHIQPTTFDNQGGVRALPSCSSSTMTPLTPVIVNDQYTRPLTIDSTYGHTTTLSTSTTPMHGDDNERAELSSNRGPDQSPTSSDSSGGRKNCQSGRPNRDPLSHRIIEKRRRDRMNNCLTNLSKLIPSTYLKKGRGRIEKTEIIEMAIRYMQQLHDERTQLVNSTVRRQINSNGSSQTAAPALFPPNNNNNVVQGKQIKTEDKGMVTDESSQTQTVIESTAPLTISALKDRYKQGYFDCAGETLRLMTVTDGMPIGEATKTQLLLHLRQYFTRTTYESISSDVNDLLTTSGTHHNQQFKPTVIQTSEPTSNSNSTGYGNTTTIDQPINMSLKSMAPNSKCTTSNHNNTSQLRHMLSQSSQSTGDHQTCSSPHSDLKHSCAASDTSGHTNQSVNSNNNNSVVLSVVAGANNKTANNNNTEQPPVAHQTTTTTNNNNAKDVSSSSNYPSSPGSSRSLSGVSTNSYTADSPPRVLSPSSATHSSNIRGAPGFSAGLLPIFALHPSGVYYVPLSVAAHTLDAASLTTLSRPAVNVPGACHPVTIPVNFSAAANAVLPNSGQHVKHHNDNSHAMEVDRK